jgi:hypothetical protein
MPACTRCRIERAHDVDVEEIDAFGEIAGDQILVEIWCRVHERYEWIWVDRALIRGDVETLEAA